MSRRPKTSLGPTMAQQQAAMMRLCGDRKSEVLGGLRPIRKRERPFESRLQNYLETNYAVLFVKAKPTRVGWPDRTALGFGAIRLVEVKRDEKAGPDDGQEIVHAQIKELTGRQVVIVHGGMRIEAAASIVVGALKGTYL